MCLPLFRGGGDLKELFVIVLMLEEKEVGLSFCSMEVKADPLSKTDPLSKLIPSYVVKRIQSTEPLYTEETDLVETDPVKTDQIKTDPLFSIPPIVCRGAYDMRSS